MSAISTMKLPAVMIVIVLLLYNPSIVSGIMIAILLVSLFHSRLSALIAAIMLTINFNAFSALYVKSDGTKSEGIYDNLFTGNSRNKNTKGEHVIPLSKAGVINGYYKIAGKVTWLLKGDCKITGRLEIKEGATLTIKSLDGEFHNIFNELAYKDEYKGTGKREELNTSCIYIEPGGTLVVDSVIFSGLQKGKTANDFPKSINEYCTDTAKYNMNMTVITNSFITAYGTLKISNSKFENFRFGYSLIDCVWGETTTNAYPSRTPGKVTITNCSFEQNINTSLIDDKNREARSACIVVRKQNPPDNVNPSDMVVTIKGCIFKKNFGAGTVRTYGYNCADITINKSPENNRTIFEENESSANGGAIHWNSHAANQDTTYTRPTLKLGNIYFYKNSCAKKGGGVMLEGNINFQDSCEFFQNKAKSGGAICLNAYVQQKQDEKGKVKLNLTVAHSLIHENEAENFGGGVMIDIPSASTLEDGSIMQCNFDKLNIYKNKATLGGALAMKVTATNIYAETYIKNCTIFKNNAEECGGGIYVSYSPEEDNISNASKNKGYLTIEKVTIEDNNTKYGGGVACVDRSVVTYKGGLISNNYAQTTESIEKSGLGGGFYISGDSELHFFNNTIVDKGAKFGVYSNLADTAGDDVYVDVGSSVTLPDVESMSVERYDEDKENSIHKMFWVEDKEGARYRDNKSDTEHDPGEFNNIPELMALTIGWDWVVDIIKKFVSSASRGEDTRSTSVSSAGTVNRMSSIVDIYEKPQSGELDASAKPYMTIPLTASDEIGNGDTRYRKRVILHNGNWLFKERNWGWTSAPEYNNYTVERSIFPYKTVEGKTERVTTIDSVEFVNTIKEYLVPNDENFIRNKLDISTSN